MRDFIKVGHSDVSVALWDETFGEDTENWMLRRLGVYKSQQSKKLRRIVDFVGWLVVIAVICNLVQAEIFLGYYLLVYGLAYLLAREHGYRLVVSWAGQQFKI